MWLSVCAMARCATRRSYGKAELGPARTEESDADANTILVGCDHDISCDVELLEWPLVEC